MPDLNFFKNLLIRNIQAILRQNSIYAIWSPTANWGDAISPILIKSLSGKNPILVDKFTLNLLKRPVFTATGSILGNAHVERHLKETNIWGIGFISKDERLKGEPKSILSVRGPLTRDILLEQDIQCPEIFGDPALLFPLFYRPDLNKRYKLGIIPHYTDKDSDTLNQFKGNQDILIIDIESPINLVVDQINMCENIASSSLHGVIASDAYGVPSTWIELSKNVAGEGFKFRDYLKSVCREEQEPFRLSRNTSFDDLMDTFYDYRIEIDIKALLKSCPFSNDHTIGWLLQ